MQELSEIRRFTKNGNSVLISVPTVFARALGFKAGAKGKFVLREGHLAIYAAESEKSGSKKKTSK